jgi:hypothetical protein
MGDRRLQCGRDHPRDRCAKGTIPQTKSSIGEESVCHGRTCVLCIHMLEVKEVGKAKVSLLIAPSLAEQVHALVGRQDERPSHGDGKAKHRLHSHSNVVPS